MLGIRYYKADPSTYVVKSINGKTKQRGKGPSFFYNSVKASISAIPINAQEAPFIFGLQTADFQEIRVQGQITFRIEDPEKTADMLNFVLKRDGVSYVSDDPMKLSDRVIQSAQAIVQERIQTIPLRAALATNTQIAEDIRQHLAEDESLRTMGINILKTTVSAISPTPETKKAHDHRFVLVTRKTRLQELIERFNSWPQARYYLEHIQVDAQDYLEEHDLYTKRVNDAEAMLRSMGLFQRLERDFLPSYQFGTDDIVVVIGQDGLVANTLKYLNGQQVIGINPDPGRWDGKLLPFEINDLASVIDRTLKGNSEQKK